MRAAAESPLQVATVPAESACALLSLLQLSKALPRRSHEGASKLDSLASCRASRRLLLGLRHDAREPSRAGEERQPA